MAPRSSRSHCFPCRNLPPIDPMEDELARDLGLVGGLHLSNTSSAQSRNPTPGPDLVPTLISTLVPTLTPALFSSDKLFRQFIKA